MDKVALRTRLLAGESVTMDWDGTIEEAKRFIRIYVLTNSEPFAVIGHLNNTVTVKLLV